MSVTRKFCEVERGLIVGRVSIDGDLGSLTTNGALEINSLSINNGAATIHNNGDTFIAGNIDIEHDIRVSTSKFIVNHTTGNTYIDGTLEVNEDSTFRQDVNIYGGDLKSTNSTFNLLNTDVLTLNFAGDARYIYVGHNSVTSNIITGSNVSIGRDLSVTRNFSIANNKVRFDSTYSAQGKTTLTGELQVGQYSLFQNDVTINGSLQVDTNTTITGNTNITGYLKVINDFNINDKLTVAHSTGDLNTLGNISATGTLTSTGNFTTADIVATGIESNSTLTKIKSTNVEISDTIVYLGTANTGALKDIGFIGHFNNGTYQHTGLLRDATDNVWKLFSNATAEITDTVDVAGVVYDAFKAGNITSTDTITATTKVVTPDVQLPNSRLTGKALTLGAWTIQEDPNNDGSILFQYNGATKFSLTSDGNLTVTQDVTSWGTPA